ncbi:hypothetical protein JOE58_000767 [Curtobacterium luteum]|uniref:Uncharacterized protein n=1 Tax=Curtobacterium luteum TaxID=33881 RepID=A0A8H9G8L6_9MICO|nr:hypothetical protein [Curtobacterium luteum]MBM7801516.1 hypothetical protein [Curtobacterium luteum]NUU52156.1 hypothetical protein [Curtobacterium luteum]GGK89878.1 hypothetical protein GCM10009769_04900 [Curtobacterium luteum]
MTARLDVVLQGSRTPIDVAVFTDLIENSVAAGRLPYRKALVRGEIRLSDLIDLARVAHVPWPLFFAPFDVVHAQVEAKTAKLLQGLSKDTFSMNSRATVQLRDVELIVKDLLRKQMLLRTHDETLADNAIVGMLRKPRGSAADDALALLDAIGLEPNGLRQAPTKKGALELLIAHLEANQVLVARSVRGFMPQLIEVKFSGLTVKDRTVPYIFLARGDQGDAQEPEGRQLFTLTLMAVLVARNIFAPVTYDGRTPAIDGGREYEITAEILMPAADVRQREFGSLDDIRAAADTFKVTPSAMLVRAEHLRLVTAAETRSYLAVLERDFAALARSQARTPKPVNGVRTYNGRALSTRMLGALDSGKITPGEFCRSVCGNRIKPYEISEFREALR